MENPIESPEPGRLERIKRLFEHGTYHVIGLEDRDQMEQALLVIAHERGGEAFRRHTETEQPLTIYRRDNTTN